MVYFSLFLLSNAGLRSPNSGMYLKSEPVTCLNSALMFCSSFASVRISTAVRANTRLAFSRPFVPIVVPSAATFCQEWLYFL